MRRISQRSRNSRYQGGSVLNRKSFRVFIAARQQLCRAAVEADASLVQDHELGTGRRGCLRRHDPSLPFVTHGLVGGYVVGIADLVVTRNDVTCCRSRSLTISSSTVVAMIGSRPVVGSSKSRRPGFAAMARAIATRRR